MMGFLRMLVTPRPELYGLAPLTAFFLLLTIWSYMSYIQASRGTRRTIRRILGVIARESDEKLVRIRSVWHRDMESAESNFILGWNASTVWIVDKSAGVRYTAVREIAYERQAEDAGEASIVEDDVSAEVK